MSLNQEGGDLVRRSYREIVDDNQPLTVTTDDVIEFLECRGQSRMANLVRAMIKEPESLRRKVEYERSRTAVLAQRLLQYEQPRSESGPRSYRAGPMSDG